jgi:hypothetical protein
VVIVLTAIAFIVMALDKVGDKNYNLGTWPAHAWHMNVCFIESRKRVAQEGSGCGMFAGRP